MSERREADYYPTPPWCVDRLLERVPELMAADLYVEPCVGDGSILRAVTRPSVWVVNDVRETVLRGCDHHAIARFLGDGAEWDRWFETPEEFKGEALQWARWNGKLVRVACLTNPPFSDGQRLLEAAMRRADLVAFLLPVSYPRARAAWWRRHRPNVYLLPDRPQFDGAGSYPVEYAWFVWGVPSEPLDILADTPVSVRKRAEEDARALLAGLDLPQESQRSLFGS